MENGRVNYNNFQEKENFPSRFKDNILSKKLHHPAVLIPVVLICIALCVVIAKAGLAFGLVGFVGLVALPTVYGIVVYPKFGVIVMLTAAYFIMYVAKLGIDFPLGTVIDGLEGLLLLGFFIHIRKEKNWKIFYNPISLMLLVWIFYNLLEALNPDAASYLSWLYSIRSVALITLTYFVFTIHTLDIKFIRFILKLWLAFAFIAAVYGFKQEYIGFSALEARILNDPRTFQLYFIDGHWRKFSIFTDPVAYAYNMVSAGLICIGLMRGPLPFQKKVILGCLAGFFMIAMLFSGTRGAYVLIPASIILFGILIFNKQVLIYGAVAAFFFSVLLVMPSGDPNIRRFQTAFRPSDDASFNVRKVNQKRIQPFIRSHAMGGGLGATGFWGARFAPNSPLADFPPDSGYVRVAVELGWIGLIIFCTLMFIILRQGIINYYRIKDPELKSICLAMLLAAFALNLGNYPQEALVQFPSSIYFYLVVALINVTWLLDKQKQEALKTADVKG